MIIMVLVLGGIISVVLIGTALSSLTNLNQHNISLTGVKTEFHTNSCAQEALLQLRRNSAYTGGTLSLDSGSCTMNVNGSGNTRELQVISTLNSFTSKLNLTVTLSPFAITAWGKP